MNVSSPWLPGATVANECGGLKAAARVMAAAGGLVGLEWRGDPSAPGPGVTYATCLSGREAALIASVSHLSPSRRGRSRGSVGGLYGEARGSGRGAGGRAGRLCVNRLID